MPIFNQQGADAVKSAAASPYLYSNKPGSQSPAVAAKDITPPVPEKDWRQSWAKAEDKPLKIQDKPAAKDSIADVPPLKIGGKAPANDFTAPKGGLSADDPLMNPDKYMPKVLDLTPIKKPADSISSHQPNAREITPKAGEKAPGYSPDAPNPVRVPTIADLAGARPEPKAPPVVDKPMLVGDASKMAGPMTLPSAPVMVQPKLGPTLPSVMDKPMVVNDASKPASPVAPAVLPEIPQPTLVPKLPAVVDTPAVAIDGGNVAGGPKSLPSMPAVVKPTIVPNMPSVTDKPMAVTDAGKMDVPVTIPALPVIAQQPVIPAIPVLDKPSVVPDSANMPGHALASSTPALPQPTILPMLPAAPLTVAPLPASVARPIPMPESRVERPSFLVMEAGNSEASDRSIKLPGVPNAVIAFGQPVTVTSPPPDMIRKKSLEAHSIRVMMVQLKESLYPSQREWAAEGLTSANWKVHPEVVEALCAAALEDPAPSVRARCAQSLAAMKVRSETALGVIHKLQADKDESVRAQADEAFKVLGPEEAQP